MREGVDEPIRRTARAARKSKRVKEPRTTDWTAQNNRVLKTAISGSDGRGIPEGSDPGIPSQRVRAAMLAITSPVCVLRAGLRHNAD